VKKLAEALEKAASGVATIGGKALRIRPGWIGDAPLVAQAVDTGQPQEPESHPVGSFDGIVVISPSTADPQGYDGEWPPDDPAIVKAITKALLPSRRKDEA
jgi:hypothetical protein